jgi:hypothetical protein
VSAAIVFVVSAVVHMVLPWHKGDYATVPNQDAVQAALRPMGILPGEYMLPRPSSHEDLRAPAFQEKLRQGPVAVLTVSPNGPVGMGRGLVLWFIYLLVVSALAALNAIVSGLTPASDFHARFHVIALAAFLGYALALWQMSIWYRRSWKLTLKATVDGILYAIFTGFVFLWLWPR